MTPSVAASFATVTPAAPFAVVSTAVHDREWWTEEAVRAGTDRSGLVAAAIEMMVAAGMVEQPQPETITPWDAPSWREAAAEYHRDPAGRLAVEIEPKRLERLRRFMAHSISLERFYDEKIGRNRATPAVTVEALKLAVREHGPKTLAEAHKQERLRRCDVITPRTHSDPKSGSSPGKVCPSDVLVRGECSGGVQHG